MADKEVQIKNAAGSGGKKPSTTQKTQEVNQLGSSTQPAKVPAKKVPQKESPVEKEVLLILREMNAKLNAQDARLLKQEEKLESLNVNLTTCSDQYDYGEDYNVDYEQYEDSEVQNPEYQDTSSTVSVESEKKGEKSVYRTVADKITRKEIVDNEINDDLAAFVNSSFRDGLAKDKMEEMIGNIYRPQNCDALVKTRVNQGIWSLLRPSTHSDDDRMQTIQENVVKACSNLVKLIDKSSDNFDNQDMEWGMHAIALLGCANKLINNRRKDLHKLDLDPKYYTLASSTMPYTDRLYGDDGDVNKNIRDINDISRIGRSIGRGYSGYNNYNAGFRGMHRGRRPHPYSRGAPRGRGRPRGNFAKNMRMVSRR